MDLNEIISHLRDDLAASAEIALWAVDAYGRTHKVYVGIDMRNPPAVGDYPCLSLAMLGKTAGLAADQIEHSIGITCGIYDEAVATNLDANSIEYAGVQHIEEYRKLVETAAVVCVAALGLRLTELKITFAPIELFPYFLCDMELTIVEDTEFGSDFFG
jgi:hypothetical protein